MTLIKKSDVHNHLSTKSREKREKAHPYKPEGPEGQSESTVDTSTKTLDGDAAGSLERPSETD